MILHAIAALAIVLTALWIPLLAVVGFAAIGFFFEKTQHRYYWSIVDGKLNREKTGWFGWVTGHRIREALGWPLGALIASIAWMLMTKFGVV